MYMVGKFARFVILTVTVPWIFWFQLQAISRTKDFSRVVRHRTFLSPSREKHETRIHQILTEFRRKREKHLSHRASTFFILLTERDLLL